MIMGMRLINLTPHEITLVGSEGEVIASLPPSGQVARCKEVTEVVDHLTINGKQFPVIVKRLGEVENLPEPQEGVRYVVSLAVAKAAKRDDLLVPGKAVRDEKGRIIGTSAFAVVRD